MDVNFNKNIQGRSLTIALGKGRGFEEALQLIEVTASQEYALFKDGIIPSHVDRINNIHLVKVRNKDLTWLLSDGYVDVAIGSEIWFDEFANTGLELFTKLPFVNCRLSVISSTNISLSAIKRICSKFPAITKQYLEKHSITPEIITMEGSHEVALSLGIADAIIDVIETGKTIKRLNLIELDCIKNCCHGIWIRKDDAHVRHLLTEHFLKLFA